jgi:hypothetical protein
MVVEQCSNVECCWRCQGAGAVECDVLEPDLRYVKPTLGPWVPMLNVIVGDLSHVRGAARDGSLGHDGAMDHGSPRMADAEGAESDPFTRTSQASAVAPRNKYVGLWRTTVPMCVCSVLQILEGGSQDYCYRVTTETIQRLVGERSSLSSHPSVSKTSHSLLFITVPTSLISLLRLLIRVIKTLNGGPSLT